MAVKWEELHIVHKHDYNFKNIFLKLTYTYVYMNNYMGEIDLLTNSYILGRLKLASQKYFLSLRKYISI